ncbi:MAG: hypothetical protein IJ558_13625 [Treponema sp.]|nr:hypothetical protein [Treponema sp.]
MRRLFFLFFAFVSVSLAFSERVISPVEGTFANKQSLILDVSDGVEAFYSYAHTNPLTSGFAYDGPVLIDASGDVSLRIVVVDGDKKEQYEVNYTVKDDGNPFAEGTLEKKFIDSIVSESVLLCAADNVVYIPKTLSFKIGDGEKPILQGAALSVSADNKLSRYIPCTVSNGAQNWRFVIYLSSGEAGVFAKFSVPFEIENWETFRFTGKNLIWCIDDGLWSASELPVKLDRTKSHTVYWQSVAYEKGNPIQSFVLAPKPNLVVERQGKSVAFSIDGDLRYRMGIVTSGAPGEAHENSGIFTTLTFDTFDGDCVQGTAVFAFYCDGVYQGTVSSPYLIDKQPPLPPVFKTSEEGFYARHDVTLRIEAEKNAIVYYSLTGPLRVDSKSYLEPQQLFESIGASEYEPYFSQLLSLPAGKDSAAVYYKVTAYAKDASENVSAVSEYKVIIDEYNYFIDGNAPSVGSDGSRSHPYNSFDQVLKVINEGRFAHFFVSGTVSLPKGETVLSSNSAFTGLSDAKFLFSPNSYLTIRSASLEMQNCVLSKEYAPTSASDERFFVLENSVVSFEDCELLTIFDFSGTAFTAHSSVINFNNSGLTTQGVNYACGISAVDSKISLKASHFASLAETAVNFSVTGGIFELNGCDCKVISHLGRIVEATGVNLKLSENTYKGEFDRKTKGVSPIWKDDTSLVLEDKNNTAEGF